MCSRRHWIHVGMVIVTDKEMVAMEGVTERDTLDFIECGRHRATSNQAVLGTVCGCEHRWFRIYGYHGNSPDVVEFIARTVYSPEATWCCVYVSDR